MTDRASDRTATEFPEWANQNVRDAIRRHLEWVTAVYGFTFPVLLRRLIAMRTDELAETCVLTDLIVSLLNQEYRHAEGVFDDKEIKRRARQTKKKLDALFKSGRG